MSRVVSLVLTLKFAPGGAVGGTAEYLAPEVTDDAYNEKIDVFAAGVLGYFC